MPSILFINRVYPPGDGATGQLLAELAEALTREGWQVTILASGSSSFVPAPAVGRATPCAPSPVQSSEFKVQSSKFEATSSFTQPSVVRVRGLPFTRTSLVRRALSYASLYPALLWRALRLPRHDVVITLTDPPLLLVLGPLLKFWKRARLVHWAQDVYPEVAEELGVVRKNGCAARMLRGLSNWSLRRHDQIIAVGCCMKERLVARGTEADKITVIPNWAVGAPLTPPLSPSPPVACVTPCAPSSVQSSEFKVQSSKLVQSSISPLAVPPTPPRPGRGKEGEVSISSVQSSEFRASGERLTVMYSGNFGLAHPFEAIIEAVKILNDASQRGAGRLASVRFVFVGAGPKFAFVREQLAGCEHVEFLEPVALENLPAALASADVHLACMSDALLGLVVPSKIYGALAAGRPCLFLGPRESEAARVILETRRGLVFDPIHGGAELAATLRRWAACDTEYTTARAACAATPSTGVPSADFLRAFTPPTRPG